MKYLYSHNPLVRAAVSLALVFLIASLALVSAGCECESYDKDGRPIENCPPAAI